MHRQQDGKSPKAFVRIFRWQRVALTVGTRGLMLWFQYRESRAYGCFQAEKYQSCVILASGTHFSKERRTLVCSLR